MVHKGNKEMAAAKMLEWRARPFNPRDARDTAELLNMCVKALQDKRASTREAALTALIGEFEKLPLLDDADKACFNVFALCGVCIREGRSLKEARLAFRAVGLLAVTHRAASPSILDEAFPLLATTIRDQDDAPTLAAAIDCLVAVTFAGARNKEHVERSMKVIWDAIFSPVSRSSSPNVETTASPQVLIAAVSAWAFLITTIVSVTDVLRKADSAIWNATFASLAGLLDHDDRAVRMAAGEALAVCVELNLTQHIPRKDMDALAAKASDLAFEAPGKGSNNTILPKQKDLFRQIAAFLTLGERPEKSLPTSMDGCVALQVSTWAKLVQLNFLRRFLGKGFEKHVEDNELFKEAFSYGADEGTLLSVAKMKQSSKTKDFVKHDRYYNWDCTIFATRPHYTARYKPKRF
ncbi:hypothetical protein PR202_gb06623 [Eleusine coracana subsp. coracana]|uniref:Interferon-related developmental regulator N-terminal domain-containing protein n=1 Tax=Eleusine coracana subsp. coracana TaxID=191504 RepID=A0AAV5EA13_ELECO|nr:hypothetical protein QOZ80_2BG0159970 [Eleusine coracana subsp. coracana]GJN19356.1 hypothetical protein PR202_gb06623 [Eleusine coracana subsp. coracana]